MDTAEAKEYRRHQRRFEQAELAVRCAIDAGICLRQFIRTALPRLSLNQLEGIQRVLTGIIATKTGGTH